VDIENDPLVLEVNGIILVKASVSDKTTLVLNEPGRLLLKKLLGGITPDEYESKSIVGKEVEWLNFLCDVL